MWSTIFAFETWHSAIELRRYFLRFIHLFPTMATMSGIYRTKFNQYDTMVHPLQKWLRDQGVSLVTEATVTNVDFTPSMDEITATLIQFTQGGAKREITVRPHDLSW